LFFPLEHNNPEWQKKHLPRISKHLSQLEYGEITFQNGIEGVIYIGRIG